MASPNHPVSGVKLAKSACSRSVATTLDHRQSFSWEGEAALEHKTAVIASSFYSSSNSIYMTASSDRKQQREGSNQFDSSPFNLLLFFIIAILCTHHSCGRSPWNQIKASLFARASSDDTKNMNATNTITFGYLRLTGVDDRSTIASFLSALHKANTEGSLPGFRYALDVTTVDCVDEAGCESALRTATGRGLLQRFIDRMPSFMAVLRPSHVVSSAVIDAAAVHGGVPVIDPITIRAGDYERANVLAFNQFVRTEIGRVFTYMQNNAGCAVSGVLYDNFSEMPTHVAYARGLFTRAGLRPPGELNVGAASDEEVRRFVLREDPSRRCFMVLVSNKVFMRVMGALVADPAFEPQEARMYGVSLMGADAFLLDGTAAPFSHTTFVRWYPTLEATNMSVAMNAQPTLDAWRAEMTHAERALFTDYGLAVPAVATDFTLQGHLVLGYLLEVVHAAITRNMRLLNRSAAVPIPYESLLETAYGQAMVVGGYPFGRPSRTCPPAPLPPVCFCNMLSQTSYQYAVDASSADGLTVVVYDRVEEGERDLASVAMPSPCSFEVGGWAYPLTGMFLVPHSFADADELDASEAMEMSRITSRTFGSLMKGINYAPVAPSRPYRYVTIADQSNTAEATNDAIATYSASYDPFVVLGSMSHRVDRSPVLTLFPSLIEIDDEDPPLVPAGQWSWQVINLRPVLADLVHAIAAYYGHTHQEAGKGYTSLHAIASSAKGAELVQKSFATFGYDVPASSVLVSGEPGVWHAQTKEWLSDGRSAHPFVVCVGSYRFAASAGRAYAAAAEATRGTLALAVPESVLFASYSATPLPPSAAEVIFPTFMSEWWVSVEEEGVPADLRAHTDNPRYHVAAAAVEFTKRLGDSVQYDYAQTAAEVLYRVQTVSTERAVYGPFSNVSCSATELARPSVSRRCQCTKGPRSLFVYSAHDFRDRRLSERTSRYRFTMTTCGVEYQPYVAPSVPFSLSRGAVGGIAAGCALAAICLLAGAAAFNYHCVGRNNRAAPKDASKPFAIVFTDIQSSTALWARAPNAMSEAIEEHHRLLRRSISHSDGYEVKTVGDSFMIAFREVDDAVAFALEAQVLLNKGSWCDEIDAIYLELLAEEGIDPLLELKTESIIHEADATNDGRGSTIFSSYSAAKASSRNPWHGLRVRVGVHYGLGEIRKDSVTQGYDYYGTVVNTAARIEGIGHGGQILITGDAFDALPEGFMAEHEATTLHLGHQTLRGLDTPVKVIQLMPISLQARRFPPLRLHIEKVNEDSELAETSTTATETSDLETPEEVAARMCQTKLYGSVSLDELLMHYYYVMMLLGSSPEKYRIETVKRLAESWGFESAAKAVKTEARKRKLLMSLLAKVTKAFHCTSNKNKGGRWSTSSRTSSAQPAFRNAAHSANTNNNHHHNHFNSHAKSESGATLYNSTLGHGQKSPHVQYAASEAAGLSLPASAVILSGSPLGVGSGTSVSYGLGVPSRAPSPSSGAINLSGVPPPPPSQNQQQHQHQHAFPRLGFPSAHHQSPSQGGHPLHYFTGSQANHEGSGVGREFTVSFVIDASSLGGGVAVGGVSAGNGPSMAGHYGGGANNLQRSISSTIDTTLLPANASFGFNVNAPPSSAFSAAGTAAGHPQSAFYTNPSPTGAERGIVQLGATPPPGAQPISPSVTFAHHSNTPGAVPSPSTHDISSHRPKRFSDVLH